MKARREIWKFPFSLTDTLWVTMPVDAEILHVAMQGSKPCLWAAVSPDAERVPRRFMVRGTGQPIPEDGRYVGTLHSPPYVWHLFMGDVR